VGIGIDIDVGIDVGGARGLCACGGFVVDLAVAKRARLP